MNRGEGVNEDEDWTAEGVVEGKWDTTNKLCEQWRAQVCVCTGTSPAGML